MIVAVLQARTSSSRLPGKVLKAILGRPMLARQIERIRRAARIDRLVVATSCDAQDDPIEALCREVDIACFRGSLENVLDRFYQAAKETQATHVARLTGDCPLVDPQVIDLVIETHLAGGYDYTSNVDVRTYPDGLDAEVMTIAALEAAWGEASLRSEREHVTPFIRKRPERFSIGHVVDPVDRSALRWTVDEPADLAFVDAVYRELYSANPQFGYHDVLALLEAQPALSAINYAIPMNEGYAKSLNEDCVILDGQLSQEGPPA